jgi:hypothetical protein
MNVGHLTMKRRDISMPSFLRAIRLALWSVVSILSVMLTIQTIHSRNIKRIMFMSYQITQALEPAFACDSEIDPNLNPLNEDNQEHQL